MKNKVFNLIMYIKIHIFFIVILLSVLIFIFNENTYLSSFKKNYSLSIYRYIFTPISNSFIIQNAKKVILFFQKNLDSFIISILKDSLFYNAKLHKYLNFIIIKFQTKYQQQISSKIIKFKCFYNRDILNHKDLLKLE